MKHFIFRLMLALVILPVSGFAYTIDTTAKQAIVVDESTGTILYEKNADEKMHPSSMSKLMTAYVAFQRLKEGKITLTDSFQVSQKAWQLQGSKMFVELGKQIPLDQLLQGIIVQSGNDACVVVAEGLAGSEEGFAAQMNEAAKSIGLENSHFVNATGWPDENHLMTARDLAILARRIIIDFPDYYHFYSQTQYTYHGITQHNRNPLLSRGLGVDGLKTGHTEQAGYGVVISGVSPEGRRIILVVNGLESEKQRAEEAEKLLVHAYRDFENLTLFKAGQKVGEAEIWMGSKKTVPVTPLKDAVVTLPKARTGTPKLSLVYEGPIQAPIKKGAEIAKLKVVTEDGASILIPLAAAEDVAMPGFFGRAWANLKYYLGGR